MAKIFRTETLNLGGNLRLEASSAGAFEIKSADGSTTHMSRASIESDISSLQAQRVLDEATTDSDISSLQAQRVADEATTDSDISSLQAQRVADEDATDSDISSLQAQRDNDEDVTDSDISSLAAKISSNDVVAKSVSQSSSAEDSGSISFGRTFSATPAVVAVLKSTNASDPIIACMVTAVSTTACTVSFADALPSANYTVEIFASVAD